MGLLRKIRGTERAAEPSPRRPEEEQPAASKEFGGSVQVRCVDAGSCNGCEIEIAAAFNPVYDAERYGARPVASPRYADVAPTPDQQELQSLLRRQRPLTAQRSPSTSECRCSSCQPSSCRRALR